MLKFYYNSKCNILKKTKTLGPELKNDVQNVLPSPDLKHRLIKAVSIVASTSFIATIFIC